MAVTNVTTKVGQAYRIDQMTHGLRVSQVELSESAYSPGVGAGIDIAANATKFGFRRIFAILAVSVRTSAGVDRGLSWTEVLNPATGVVKIRLYQAQSANVEITGAGAGATQLATTDIVDVVLMGV